MQHFVSGVGGRVPVCFFFRGTFCVGVLYGGMFLSQTSID